MTSNTAKVIEDFLGYRRYDPPERDGWYSGYEISLGIKRDLGKRVGAARLYPALQTMLDANPPVVEDTWMRSDEQDNPLISEQYEHPGLPQGARRFYRVLATSAEYILPE